jgi:hypothetical protein
MRMKLSLLALSPLPEIVSARTVESRWPAASWDWEEQYQGLLMWFKATIKKPGML